MKLGIILTCLVLAIFNNKAVADDNAPVGAEEPSASSTPAAPPTESIDIVVSEEKPLDLSGINGPFSFSSLPKDVREKIIKGLDDNGHETASQMLRRTSDQARDFVNTNRPEIAITANTNTLGDQAVQLVRRVRGESSGLSFKLKNRTFDTVGGQKVKAREYWIYYRMKFN